MNWWKDLNPVKNTKAIKKINKIFNGIKIKIKFQELMKDHTTFKIGGPAKYFVEPRDVGELKLLLDSVKRYKIPILAIGAGSNILINDKGVEGVVLHLNSPLFKRIYFKHNRLYAGSGAELSQIVLNALKHGLSGVEFMAGIPGTIGGALIMNAGIPQKFIGDLVENVTVMDYNGNIKTLNKKNIKFGYRKSSLSKYIILSTCIRMIKKSKHQIKDTINSYLEYRHLTQDLSKPSAGCIFKNPKRISAGRLIDLCGLKGKRIGDAYISRRHANFILNQGNACARDVLKLMDLVQKKVKSKFNIILEPEIKIWQ